MLRITILFFISAIGIVAGCDGGGVGGASWDSKKDIAEVESYQEFISPKLSESIIQNKCVGSSEKTWDGISQHFQDILRSFSLNLEKLESQPADLSEFGLTATFDNHKFLVRNKGKVLIEENLPSVFVMHPMRLGIDDLSGVPVIMVVNKSRASTGRFFVAIYGLDGTPLYKNVLAAWQVWDINLESSHIDILGCGETRRIIMEKN